MPILRLIGIPGPAGERVAVDVIEEQTGGRLCAVHRDIGRGVGNLAKLGNDG